MKHLSSRKKTVSTPEYQLEAKALRALIIENWWNNGGKKYYDFSKECKTSVSIMANELEKAINQYKHNQISEEQVANKFRYTLDLIDYYAMQKK